MASPDKRLETNVSGDFYVDSTCIDCGTCRWMTPEVFDLEGDYSRVYAQPSSDAEVFSALQALVACPTASIGTVQKHDVRSVAGSFPFEVADGVYHCGYHHRSSFGAASYFIKRPEGNVLVDSPRYVPQLAKRIEAMGGVKYMFLTHQDDVAEHAKFAERFGCERILHADDVTSSTRDVEHQPKGIEPVAIAEDLLVIPVPGHTKGSACLLYNNEFLFTGDHLAWSLAMERVYAFRRACWYDWDTQIESMKRLAEYRFAHILPGHGAPCRFEADEMHERMKGCVRWMEDPSP